MVGSKRQFLPVASVALLVVPALLRCLTLTLPDLYFADDPLVLPFQPGGIGPAGSVFLDFLSLVGCSLAIVACRLERKKCDAWQVLLLLLPVPVLTWHLVRPDSTIGQWTMGSHWLGAMATLVGAAHIACLQTFRPGRAFMVASFFALTAPLAVKAVYQITVEHGMTVEDFHLHKESILAARGWDPESIQARLFAIRLLQREATGWCSISNVFGTLVAGMAVFWLCMLLAVARSRLSGGWIGLTAIVAGASLTALASSGSRGAIGGMMVGAILATAMLLPRQWRRRASTMAPGLSIMLPAAALLGTACRGWLLGPDFKLDGYSLLFRWYYWVGAMRSFAANVLSGVGPDGFQEAFMVFKPALSPEQPALPHSVFISWLAAMGIVATAWMVLTMRLVRKGAPGVASTDRSFDLSDEPRHAAAPITVPAMLVGGVLLVLTIWINGSSVLPDYRWVFGPLSIAGFTGLVILLPRLVNDTSWWAVHWAAWSAIVVMLVHAQIELTLNDPGPASAIFMLIGAVGGTRVDSRLPLKRPAAVLNISAVVIPAFVALAHGSLVALPIQQHQQRVASAARELSTCAVFRRDMERLHATEDPLIRLSLLHDLESHLSQEEVETGIDGLVRQIGALPRDVPTDQALALWRAASAELSAAILKLQAKKIRVAIPLLEDALRVLPADDRLVRDLAGLRVVGLRLAVRHSEHSFVATQISALSKEIPAMADRWPRSPTILLTASARLSDLAGVQRTVDQSDVTPLLLQAFEYLNRAAALDPYGVDPALASADMAKRLGKSREAIRWYQKTLLLNEGLRLDPARQLDKETVRRINDSITALAGS